MRLQAAAISVALDGQPVLDRVSLAVEVGECVGVVGPNGSGKSTFLRTVYRGLRPDHGAIWLGGDDVWRLSARASAQRTAVVAQERAVDFDFSAWEIVLMGRGPHKGLLERDSPDDRALVERALARVGATHLRDRVFSTLSGGERQRVLVARALAQESRVLVLDEPTNHLDAHAQLALLELVTSLGVTTIVALHDLELAARYCSRVYVLDRGALVAEGPPRETLSPELLARVFRVEAEWVERPSTGTAHLILAPLDQAPNDH